MTDQTSASEAHVLLARHRQVMPDWMALYYEEPLEIVSGSGRHVVGGDGRTYLDFFGGLLATMVGHGVEEIVEAIRSQARKLLHSSTLYLIRQQVELAEKIAKHSRIPDARVFFVNSGSEAVETAFLITTTAAKSNQVLALRGSYHGRTFGTVATTGIRAWSATSLSPLQVSYVHSGYRYRSPFGALPDEQFVDACIDELRTIIETTTSGQVACMIAEPIQGAGGFASPPDGFFRRTKAVLDEYGIPLVSDEIQSGWGRTGRDFFSMHAHGVEPEAITFAKGLANGMSIGGVVASADLMNAVQANSISTAGGNPLAMAAANATLDYILDHELQANADARGRELLVGLRSLAESHPGIGEVRGEGLMIGVELVVPGTKTPNVAYTLRILEKARELGLLIGRGGLLGNVLRITPPMSVTKDECLTALSIVRDVFAQTAP
ncbi:aspartate aminotransferase family protein [Microbacterium sp. NIBRBAC000506063]|uniref:aspartate aminotransferase family protein n=1 Tax=Microbacterium sp. NIBRBAC000506063 TaxID=2734618 RepID=UPI001BB7D535|nr:aminotransferase class III-fold pyridoxal phosphate-dependent enzyme [Microbacterium sp. NIBRBAC000506063]QTV80901.1 aminotransferase class III-fold pyridoxal phosphate-dependent enzyme [Microbacterium sp. NIBRBAC000506063]